MLTRPNDAGLGRGMKIGQVIDLERGLAGGDVDFGPEVLPCLDQFDQGQAVAAVDRSVVSSSNSPTQ